MSCSIFSRYAPRISSSDCNRCGVVLLSVRNAGPNRFNLKQMMLTPRWDKDMLVKANKRMVPALNAADAIYDVGCRSFLNANLEYREGMHSGCHPALFQRVVTHTDFPQVLRSMKETMTDDYSMSRRNMALLLCDVTGRHAAMAVGKAFAECFVSDPDVSLGTVHVLANQDTGNSCGICARCEFWTRRWTSRNNAVAAVKAVWFEEKETIVLSG
jgi:hypothetical protein